MIVCDIDKDVSKVAYFLYVIRSSLHVRLFGNGVISFRACVQ